MAVTWADLAELRSRGQRPTFSLVVTTWPKPWRPHAKELFEAGVMVIQHEAGKPMPVELLEGLDVILAFDSCDQTVAVFELLRRRGVSARVHGWCQCYREFTVVPDRCSAMHEQIAALEECCAA